jgi:biopolymer transport protein ExbB/TolQ
MSSVVRSLIALAIAIIGIHLIYVGVIRPDANLAIETAGLAGKSAPRDLSVILKDYEQEICLILMFWGVYLIGEKYLGVLRHRHLFDVDLLGDTSHEHESLRSTLEGLEELPESLRHSPLVGTLLASLRRYLITGDVQNTSDAIDSSIEALSVKQEAENSMIRYLIWAIPSIGFVGTVRGIGIALSKADEALAGDIAGMTDALGVAFNSTLVALLISLVLMFLLHQLQRIQDDVVVSTQSYCETFLLKRISPAEGS